MSDQPTDLQVEHPQPPTHDDAMDAVVDLLFTAAVEAGRIGESALHQEISRVLDGIYLRVYAQEFLAEARKRADGDQAADFHNKLRQLEGFLETTRESSPALYTTAPPPPAASL
jgi:hypothetical protein